MKKFKLNETNKLNSGFTTPDGYFDSFSEKVLMQLPKEEPEVISIFSRKKIWYYAAASVVVLLGSVLLYNYYTVNTQELEAVAYEEYMTNHMNMSNEDMATLLSQEDLDKMKLELHLEDEALEEVLLNNTDIEQYITN
ncbi:hypothetical protein [Flavobacterium sp.]|uniref:hypothetical protein n=1 Tax=Flavobacterium sp. TaxID=239 RepID=UPI002FDE012F